MSVLDEEFKASRIKSMCVKIGNEFRAKRPDHEFTEMFGEIEKHIYSQHEHIIKLMHEVVSLKFKLAEIEEGEELDFGFEEPSEAPKPITESEWVNKPMQSKIFSDDKAPF